MPRDLGTRPCQVRLWCFLLSAVLVLRPVSGVETSLEAGEDLPVRWIRTVETRAFSGYKDNVLLGSRNQVASGFVGGGVDLTLFRLPERGWEYTLFSSGEYLRYLDAVEVSHETTALVHAQAAKDLSNSWKLSLAAEYVYFDQVLDASTFEEQILSLQIEGHAFTLKPTLTKGLGQGFKLDMELPATRQFFGGFVDDYWEFGPKFNLTRAIGRSSDVSLSYQFSQRLHDTREPRDSKGNVESRQSLVYFQHEVAATWRQYWDDQKRWRTITKLTLQRNEDNGGGYYAYWRPQFSEQLRFQIEKWEVRADARVFQYWYDNQRVGDIRSARREKTFVRVGLRGEKALTRTFKIFAQYEYERAFSNLSLDAYSVNSISGGVEWEF